jgi:serine/threonine protein phosphatase PrpC
MNLKNVLEIASRSDIGRLRSRNEDCVGEDLEIGVVLVADGMGGYRGGDVASAIAVNTILEHLKACIPGITPGEIDAATGYSGESLAVRQAVVKANNMIYRTGEAEPRYRGMGTTLVMAVFYDNRVTIANVGDSRMYRFRDGRLEQVTVDHTLRQELVDRGFCTPAEARTSLNKNLVTRAVGTEPAVTVDIREDVATPNDIYLLCSDGLSDMLDDRDMCHIVKTLGADLDKTAERLISVANENGGKDNISVILVRPKKDFPAKRHWNLVSWLTAG